MHILKSCDVNKELRANLLLVIVGNIIVDLHGKWWVFSTQKSDYTQFENMLFRFIFLVLNVWRNQPMLQFHDKFVLWQLT